MNERLSKQLGQSSIRGTSKAASHARRRHHKSGMEADLEECTIGNVP